MYACVYIICVHIHVCMLACWPMYLSYSIILSSRSFVPEHMLVCKNVYMRVCTCMHVHMYACRLRTLRHVSIYCVNHIVLYACIDWRVADWVSLLLVTRLCIRTTCSRQSRLLKQITPNCFIAMRFRLIASLNSDNNVQSLMPSHFTGSRDRNRKLRISVALV